MPDTELEDIRRDIDSIDEALLDLVGQRFAASEQVRAIKARQGTLAGSPFRPAREAQILRRLALQSNGLVPPDLLIRLWRSILTASMQTQAQISIHVSKKLSTSTGLRLRIRDHFGTIPVEEYRDERQALMQVNASPGDLCIVETEGPWVEPYMEGMGGRASVVACLPFLREDPVPRLLVFGHAPSEPTGEDETLIISAGKLPRDFTPAPLWQIKTGTRRVSCLPGHLSEHESPLIGLTRTNAALALRIAGRYPSPLETII